MCNLVAQRPLWPEAQLTHTPFMVDMRTTLPCGGNPRWLRAREGPVKRPEPLNATMLDTLLRLTLTYSPPHDMS